MWRGVIKFKGKTVDVEGWSFDDRPPLFWGASLIRHKHHGTAEQIAMWGWLHLSDSPDRQFQLNETAAARDIGHYLGIYL